MRGRTLEDSYCFNLIQLKTVRRARERAAGFVSHYYRVAPREWRRMPYEVKTLRALDSSEVTDTALAQTVCYGYRREAGPLVLEEGDFYRICLQDHRILDAARETEMRLSSMLTYVLTHELVHVVRFGQQLQRVDLPYELRPHEEQRVEKTTRAILAKAGDPEINRFLSSRVADLF
jgi:predicted Zn-dependent protease with MMP-like domain